MAAGLPVLATDVGGNPELVADGHTGRLVPAADPSALAAAVSSYLERPDLAREHGAAGRRRAEEFFSLERMRNAYARLYVEAPPAKVRRSLGV